MAARASFRTRQTNLFIAACLACGAWSGAQARSIYLNGIDISSAKNQELKNVSIRINDHGDVFIEAPQYQVNEEDSFTPLSQYVQGLNLPTHQSPGQLPAATVQPNGVPVPPVVGVPTLPPETKTQSSGNPPKEGSMTVVPVEPIGGAQPTQTKTAQASPGAGQTQPTPQDKAADKMPVQTTGQSGNNGE